MRARYYASMSERSLSEKSVSNDLQFSGGLAEAAALFQLVRPGGHLRGLAKLTKTVVKEMEKKTQDTSHKWCPRPRHVIYVAHYDSMACFLKPNGQKQPPGRRLLRPISPDRRHRCLWPISTDGGLFGCRSSSMWIRLMSDSSVLSSPAMVKWLRLLIISLLCTGCLAQASAWWLMSQMQMSAVSGSSPALCDLIPGLGRRQRRLCQLHPDVMKAISDGIRRGVAECQTQFAGYRWNCTTVEGGGFGRIILKLGSREAAFVYSISTASVVHSIARSCSTSQISDCSCDRRRVGRGQDSQGEFSWGGCSDNLPYAISFARKFIDSKDRRSRDGRALMNLHNNRAGRKAVKRNLKIQCKCHGVSGSCATRTCWRALPHLSIIGADLADKYHEALQVTVNPNGEGLIPADHRRYDFLYGPKAALFQRKRINRAELVYFEPSPDYCEADIRTGKI
ncbi:Protein Wnt-2 [Trichinella murrelli]|uniref:Protein Wnt n=1 Tax=Trichinella murrelli TaxID=144512 RepID=A0A0V0U256_9BILA|nr:Protein Wnt-2 [Trichinella murrelli]